jgi:hypothetical protein
LVKSTQSRWFSRRSGEVGWFGRAVAQRRPRVSKLGLKVLFDYRSNETAVAQWAKAPGIHCYVAGWIPAVTPRYCTYKENRKMLFGAQKKKKKKMRRQLKQPTGGLVGQMKGLLSRNIYSKAGQQL